ncbi:MAG TPA: hypothetical protein ENJ56_08315 [Anaerolineae bacterium]|nr:hypothetical protein [Anaerolineae bacterium]
MLIRNGWQQFGGLLKSRKDCRENAKVRRERERKIFASVYRDLNFPTQFKYFSIFLIILYLGVACGGNSAETTPQILFMRQTSADVYQLFLTNTVGDEVVQVSSAEFGIQDYAVAPDGHAIALAWKATEPSSDIWLIEKKRGKLGEPRQLLACPVFSCQSPVWATDNRRIIYLQHPTPQEPSRLWWVDSKTGETVPVFDDPKIRGNGAQLSPDDQYLSFILIPYPNANPNLPIGPATDENGESQLEQGLVVYNFATGKRLVIPNQMNSESRWRPNSAEPQLIFSDLQFFGERFGIHLFQTTVNDNNVIDITDGRLLEDATPNWSPDGSQIAFTRKSANTAMGRQLWLMDTDGSNTRALTENVDWHHGEPRWSADASTLLFQRFDNTQTTPKPAIWIINLENSTEQLIAENGVRPQWLP